MPLGTRLELDAIRGWRCSTSRPAAFISRVSRGIHRELSGARRASRLTRIEGLCVV